MLMCPIAKDPPPPIAVRNNGQSSSSIQASRGPCVQRLEVDGTCWRHYFQRNVTSVLPQTGARRADVPTRDLLHFYTTVVRPVLEYAIRVQLSLALDRCTVRPARIRAETRNSYRLSRRRLQDFTDCRWCRHTV